ncbi:MAG: hypothetical protein IPK35_05665 [Saprospiraceae bacterium]|nr:hypothetical protein [Saprospiraceae bacterium]
MQKQTYAFILGIVIFISISGFSQSDTVRLKNPSFEDNPKRGGEAMTGISGWFDCGKINFPSESPPDIHPNGYWGNNLPAYHGKTYLGMVARDNGTYESVSQKLNSRLLKNTEYEFTLNIAKSKNYISRTRTSGIEANYTNPIVLRIWGGLGSCEEKELLYSSAPINHNDWRQYIIRIKPNQDLKGLTFEAYYKPGTVTGYNGHILLDAISDIIKIN